MIKESLNDFYGKDNEWTELYFTLGIPVGTSITIQNKGCVSVLILLRATKPDASNSSGWELRPSQNSLTIPFSEGMGLYIKGSAPLHVLVGWDIQK